MELKPTFKGVIKDELDALLIFQATLNGILSHIPRRPYEMERQNLITSGNIFVFFENLSGIKRWTDGISWSPSRISGKFLIYKELNKFYNPNLMINNNPSKKNSNNNNQLSDEILDSTTNDSSSSSIKDENFNIITNLDNTNTKHFISNDKNDEILKSTASFKYTGFIKKTISVKIKDITIDNSYQTLHLISYYSIDDVKNNKLIEPKNYDPLKNIQISNELLDNIDIDLLKSQKNSISSSDSNSLSSYTSPPQLSEIQQNSATTTIPIISNVNYPITQNSIPFWNRNPNIISNQINPNNNNNGVVNQSTVPVTVPVTIPPPYQQQFINNLQIPNNAFISHTNQNPQFQTGPPPQQQTILFNPNTNQNFYVQSPHDLHQVYNGTDFTNVILPNPLTNNNNNNNNNQPPQSFVLYQSYLPTNNNQPFIISNIPNNNNNNDNKILLKQGIAQQSRNSSFTSLSSYQINENNRTDSKDTLSTDPTSVSTSTVSSNSSSGFNNTQVASISSPSQNASGATNSDLHTGLSDLRPLPNIIQHKKNHSYRPHSIGQQNNRKLPGRTSRSFSHFPPVTHSKTLLSPINSSTDNRSPQLRSRSIPSNGSLDISYQNDVPTGNIVNKPILPPPSLHSRVSPALMGTASLGQPLTPQLQPLKSIRFGEATAASSNKEPPFSKNLLGSNKPYYNKISETSSSSSGQSSTSDAMVTVGEIKSGNGTLGSHYGSTSTQILQNKSLASINSTTLKQQVDVERVTEIPTTQD